MLTLEDYEDPAKLQEELCALAGIIQTQLDDGSYDGVKYSVRLLALGVVDILTVLALDAVRRRTEEV